MSIFGAIKDAILGHHAAATAAPEATAEAPVAAAAPAPEAAATPKTEDEIYARLDQMAQEKGVRSNYRTSIVDLMSLIGLDSSHANRIELANELGYDGDTNDSATMNIWLHGKVMESLANAG